MPAQLGQWPDLRCWSVAMTGWRTEASPKCHRAPENTDRIKFPDSHRRGFQIQHWHVTAVRPRCGVVQKLLAPAYTERRQSRAGQGIPHLECYPDLNHTAA